MVNLDLLKETIKERGVTQAHIAKKLNITYVALCNKTRGKHAFSLGEALELKRILRLTQEEWDAIFDA